MISPKPFGMQLIVAAFIMIIAIMSSQNVIASVYAGQNVGMADLDVEEAAEGVTNQTITNGNTTGVEFLSIQSAQSGSLSEINATAYTLELSNVSDKTILFSDRPDRIVTSVSTSDFVGNWTKGEDSFAIDPPNAALVFLDGTSQDIKIVELFNPMYDSAARMLEYDITLDNATSSFGLPNEFGQSTLLIDIHFGPSPADG